MKISTKITLIYLIAGIAWILGSDWLLSTLFPASFPVISIYKGWAFILVTAALLFALLSREEVRRDTIEQSLRTLAIYDPLTGLANRACLVENLERAVALADREDGSVGVVFMDLDGFKAVNDGLGHHVGDALLIEVAARLRQVARASDLVARFGGDEFVVLAPNNTPGTVRMAERMVEALRQPFAVLGHAVRISASAGVALYPEHGRQAEQLVRAADQAMYQVKASGRDAINMAGPMAD